MADRLGSWGPWEQPKGGFLGLLFIPYIPHLGTQVTQKCQLVQTGKEKKSPFSLPKGQESVTLTGQTLRK